MTILLAGSEERLLRVISLSLKTSGYDLIVARYGEEAIQRARGFKGPIHLLLADLDIPGMSGIELAQHLTRERPDSKVLLFCNLRAGMLLLSQDWQFLPTPFVIDMLTSRVRDILRETKGPAPAPFAAISAASPGTLTKRQIEVLRLIATGHSTKQIAAILGITFKTSVGHRSRLMKKLGIHDSVNLARYAIRMGLIEP